MRAVPQNQLNSESSDLDFPLQLGLKFLPTGALFFEFGFQVRLLFEYLIKPFL